MHALFPELQDYHFVHPSDRRFKRNVDRLRNVFQEIIDDRKKGLTKDFDGKEADLLSIMLKSDTF